MSSSDSAPDADDADTEPIYVSIPGTDTAASIGAPISSQAATPVDGVGAYIDAPNGSMSNDGWELPCVSRHISDGEPIMLLAAMRGKDGKHRFSANKIARLVGGSHNT